MIVIDYTDFPLPTQRPNSLTVRSVYFTSLMGNHPHESGGFINY